MTTEEKARAYDEALDRIGKELQKCGYTGCDTARQIFRFFPEDMEIRKDIIKNLERYIKCVKDGYDAPSAKDFVVKEIEKQIAWLEKQGEQKSADKIEPKLKVEEGKWYVCTQTFVLRGKIVIIKGQTYQAEQDNVIKGEDGCLFVVGHDGKASDYFRPWTIQDAKDGDVLVHNGCSFIFVGIKDDIVQALEENLIDGTNPVCFGELEDGDYYPATKEQRDALMKAMTDAGYTFDFEKKELKKIKNEIEIPFGAKDSELQEVIYHIPKGFHAEIDDDKVVIKKGNKEDESWFKEIELMCLNFSNDTDYREEFFTWLKSLKDRVQQQSKQDWSEEDEMMVKDIIAAINALHYHGMVSWLKSLKDRIQPKQEWSEEDEKMLNYIDITLFEEKSIPNVKYWKIMDWLKSLRPHKQWKPSEEQMDALETAVSSLQSNTLETLYQDLKRETNYKILKGEKL